MPETMERLFKLTALAVMILIVFQIRTLLGDGSGDPSAMEPLLRETSSEFSSDGSDWPPAFDDLASSVIFGVPPAEKPHEPPPRPVLLGLMDGAGKQFAILRTPDGTTIQLTTGETQRDVKLIRIGTNRALVEFRGKEIEISLFSGLGSPSLLEK